MEINNNKYYQLDVPFGDGITIQGCIYRDKLWDVELTTGGFICWGWVIGPAYFKDFD